MVDKKAPELRFKGFTEDWELCKLGEISQILTGGTPKTQIKEFWEPKEIPWMSSGEINKKRLISTDNQISKLGFENSSARWIKESSVLIALAGQGKTRGTVAINEIPLTTNQSIAAIEPDDNLDSEFLFQNLENRYEELRLASSGDGSRGGLNKRIISDILIKVPSIKEQSQVGLFFKYLDNIITLHQRKLVQLKTLKQAYLQQLFPSDGEYVPKVRFANFNQDWEQRKLGELAESFEYGLNSAAISFDGENKYLRITDIDDSSNLFKQNSLTSPDTNLETSDNYLLKKGDVLFARTGASVGKTYRYQETDGKVYYAGFLIRARIKLLFDSEFVFQNTLSSKYNNFIKITSQRSGQPGINAQEYRNFELYLPTLKEQQNISSFLKMIDGTITLHQHKLESLNKLKQAYLQKMFI